MALESDSQGFLIGTPIDLGRIPGYLLDIKRDIEAIKKSITGLGLTASDQPEKAPSIVFNRDASGGVSTCNTPSDLPNIAGSASVIPGKTASEKSVAVPARVSSALPARDAFGRFISSKAPTELSRGVGLVSEISAHESAENPPNVPAETASAVQGRVNKDRHASINPQQPDIKLIPGREAAVQADPIAEPTGSRRSEKALTALAESLGVGETAKQAIVDKMRRSASRAQVAVPKRGKDGRFVGSDSSGSHAPESSKLGGESGAVSVLANKLSNALSIGGNLEDVDPSIKAFREVAEPMQRGIEFFQGGKDSGDTKWLRKIFGTLNVFRKDESIYNKEANKRLKAIEEKPAAVLDGDNGGTGIGSIVGGGLGAWLLGKAKGLFGAGSAASAVGVGAATAGGGLMAAAKGLGGGLIKGGKGLLRRIPIIGALLTAAGMATDVYGSESEQNLSRREKDQRTGRAVGGWSGSLSGAIGGAIAGSTAGPIGTFIGGVVGSFLGDQAGQIIGEKFGEWVSDLREFDIGGKIISAWDGAIETIVDLASDAWDKAKEFGGKTLNVAVEQLNDWNTFISKTTGVNVKGIGKAWWERTKENASVAWQSTKNTASTAGNWIKNETTVGKAVSGIADLLKSDGMTRIFRREDGSVETRNGGSRSWRNNNPGNIEYGDFTKKFGAIGSDGRFAIFPSLEAGRKAKEELLFNGKGYRGKTLSEAIARYAPPNENDTAGYQRAVISAVGGRDKVMADYSPAERAAILGAIEKREGFKPGIVKIANTSAIAPSAPKMPMSPPISESPQIIQPLGSSQPQQFTVNLPSQDVGRDLSDRRLAHIVTGGLGG